jgi:hypothetical protein
MGEAHYQAVDRLVEFVEFEARAGPPLGILLSPLGEARHQVVMPLQSNNPNYKNFMGHVDNDAYWSQALLCMQA